VSGGGYIGAFFGAWVHRRGIDAAEAGLAGIDGSDPASLPVRYLRENGRYLTPNGSTDAWLLACSQVRNQFTLLFLLLLPLIGTLLLAEGLKAWFGTLPPALTAALPVASVFWPLAGALAAGTALALGIPYWYIGAARRPQLAPQVLFLCLGWTVAAAWAVVRLFAFAPQLGCLWPAGFGLDALRAWGHAVREIPWGAVTPWLLLVLLGVAVVAALLVAALATDGEQPRRRRQFSDLHASGMAVAALVALFATIDTLGQWVAREVHSQLALASGPLTLAVVVAAAQRLGPWLAGLGQGSRLQLSVKMWAWLGAGAFALVVLVFTSAALHSLAIVVAGSFGARLLPAAILLGAGGAAWALAWLFGRDFRFVNHSSLHRVYSARLTRTYVGASSAERTGGVTPNLDATDVLEHDDVATADYQPHVQGGPLHLINVTVNETLSGQSNVDKEDRHGLGMALGPVALSVGPRASMARPAGALGALSLGDWTGASGAAFTTGMGAKTSLPLSFLLCAFNVRLGYWWDSRGAFRLEDQPAIYPGKTRRGGRVRDYSRKAFPAQSGLFDEMTARFRGPSQPHWYLSDGGHFENTACYELLRRQVPLIVCCDCGADPQYAFEDVANLVRKARIDFGAEIEFLPAEVAAGISPVLGSLDELKPVPRENDASLSVKHAAVATVRYLDGNRSVLLLIKPTLAADAPIDLLEYDSTDRSFPQQTTLDQFFDEAQWESYRKLGQFIGEKLFAASGEATADLWARLTAEVCGGALLRPAALSPTAPRPGGPAPV